MNNLDRRLEQRLSDLRNKGLYRRVISIQGKENGFLLVNGKRYLNLSGNDYLGLASNRKLVEEFYSELNSDICLSVYGPGASASRFMTGNSSLYEQLEMQLAILYGREQAVIFNSGYHLNLGLLPALTTKSDLIIADKLCHASLIDSMKLSRASFLRYSHNDYTHLATILARKRSEYEKIFLVTESIFSMDGDSADLCELVNLKQKYDCCLLVDEAHAIGMIGAKGLGLAEQQNVLDSIDIFIGTCGKALGGQGGFTVCSRIMAEYLFNSARSLIYTTGLPPVSLAWLSFVLKRFPEMNEQREKVRELAGKLRESLKTHGLTSMGTSHIVPVIIGDNAKTVEIAEKLREQGFWVTAVRPPTVPENSARLRLSITAAMNWQELAPIPALIAAALD